MADVRALLKAKRQEARITHPYATYTTAGQLKCSVCGSIVKFASAWEGHLGSKLHRTNVVRMREEEKRQREIQEQQQAQAAEVDEDEEEIPEQAPTGKRKATGDVEPPNEKKRKVEASAKGSKSSFPSDFFSDPSRAPASLLSPDSDEGENEEAAGEGSTAAQPTLVPKDSVVDLEYERFQRELLASAAAAANPREAYERATVAAEAVPASTEIAGFPPSGTEVAEPAPPELTEEELRRKRDEEERELIMDRLLEEERAQEDADTRVLLLKNKLDSLRRKRELAKASKAKAPPK
ncbi:hypothetical protein BDN70DRAFT_299366 [Pholiota conissans]|uniref:Coiled-coil domain-containing protein 16 n=1 Tax=Pholiota conissans TaxID=109636 RepID=A0A9P6CWK0_9AGAR|nr:hypothetical protein BDN70DRAFT_299366 [Pholiota conissans]